MNLKQEGIVPGGMAVLTCCSTAGRDTHRNGNCSFDTDQTKSLVPNGDESHDGTSFMSLNFADFLLLF